MKRIGLGALYEAGILGLLLLIVLHAPLSVGLGQLFPDHATVIKAWKEFLLAGLSIAALVLIVRHKHLSILSKSIFMRLSIAYVAVHLVLVVIFGGDVQSVMIGLATDLRLIAVFVLCYILVQLRQGALRRIVWVVAAGALVVTGFGILQITVLPDDVLARIGYTKSTIQPYITIDSNSDYVRINSTLRGPNPLGAITVIYLAMLLAYGISIAKKRQLKERQSLGMFIVSGIATASVLFASYSRSAYIAAIAAVLLVVLWQIKMTKKRALISIGIVLVLAAGLVGVAQTTWFSNVILHENPESLSRAKSNEGHVTSLIDGMGRAARQPLGGGIGSTGSASLYDADQSNDVIIENNYLFIAHESGWIGLALFLALFGGIIWKLIKYRRSDWLALSVAASGIGLAIIGLLLPVWADDTVSILWWGLAGATIASVSGIMENSNAKRARKQKTTRTA